MKAAGRGFLEITFLKLPVQICIRRWIGKSKIFCQAPGTGEYPLQYRNSTPLLPLRDRHPPSRIMPHTHEPHVRFVHTGAVRTVPPYE